MPPLSPQIQAMPSSPRNSTGGRPSITKRHSSQSSQAGKHNVTSPGSVGDHPPLRHPVGARRSHTKIVLPRNHSSARNLAKLGKQAQQQQNYTQAAEEDEGARKHGRKTSHEGDTDIRLPGSLDEGKQAPPMRRNMTAYQLPRNTSHTKLKKNLSHGQLTRLQHSGRNLKGMQEAAMKAPPSPGLKARNKRPKSADIARDMQEQEAELYRQQKEEREVAAEKKKVGFAVGSAGTTSGEGDEDVPDMEGSGLQEDEWTDQSASASPYSTRQNTANNSRRPSVVVDKPPDREKHTLLAPGHPSVNFRVPETKHRKEEKEEAQRQKPEAEADGTPAQSADEAEEDDDEAEALSPRSQASHKNVLHMPAVPLESSKQPIQPHAPQRSPLHAAKDHPPNPLTRKMVDPSYTLPAPALVSNVSADARSMRGSPAPSMRSSRSNLGESNPDQDPDELVSRFIPTASDPSTGSGGNTSTNTPKHGSLHTPEEDSALHRAKFHAGGPVSPGSTISGSSGAATPALGRSRIELRMLHDKALADREAIAERQPLVPHHIYDRRNETLKSYLNLAALGAGADGYAGAGLSLGPEIFQGRFKAVNTELKVVQKFRDPIGDSVARLRMCRATRLGQRESPQKQQAALRMSKSAVSLPARPATTREASKLSTSASPPATAQAEISRSASPEKLAGGDGSREVAERRSGIPNAKSALQIKTGESRRPRREVSFAGTPPEKREYERSMEELGPDAIARQMWESVGA